MQFSTNSAYAQILADDRKYHIVFLVVGGFFLLLLLIFSWFAWRQFKWARPRTFARKTYFSFGVASLALDLFMAVAFWANVTSVVDPAQTLAGTTFSPLGQAWVRSGSAQVPPLLRQAIHDRLAWQRPKALVCGVLFLAFVALTLVLWRTLIRQSATGEPVHRLSRRLMLGAGVLSACICVLLMLMVIGNTEGAFAPLTLTVIYG